MKNYYSDTSMEKGKKREELQSLLQDEPVAEKRAKGQGEPEKPLTCPIYFDESLKDKDIKELEWPEKRRTCPIYSLQSLNNPFIPEKTENQGLLNEVTEKEQAQTSEECVKKQPICPLHFGDEYRENADKEYEAARRYMESQGYANGSEKKSEEQRTPQISSDSNQEMQTNVPEKCIREGMHFCDPGVEWRRPAIHFYDPDTKNGDKEYEAPEKHMESQGYCNGAEKKSEEQRTPQISSAEVAKEQGSGVCNKKSVPLEKGAGNKLETKGNCSDLSEEAVTKVETAESVNKKDFRAGRRDKPITPLHFLGGRVQETGEIIEERVSEENAGSITFTREAIQKFTGHSALELIHGHEESKNPDELLKNIRKSRPKAISNFDVIPVKIIWYIDSCGQENGDGKIICNIIIHGRLRRSEYKFEIGLKETGNLTGYILKKYPTAIIFDPKGKNARAIENSFRSRISEAKSEICYVNAGWNQVKGNPLYIYKDIQCQGVMTNTQLNLPVDPRIVPRDISNHFGRILTLYNDKRTLYALLTYSYLGIFYKVFDDAGWPPHFLLFMHGVTGSMKTSIAKLLYVQLCDDAHRKHPRRLDTDSEASMERGLVLAGKDTVTLFDDWSPAKTVQKGNEMKNKLETLIRMAGDGSTKSRSNTNLEDRRGEGIQGVLVVTGELKATGLSSNLRCLYCEIKKEYVNTDTLSWLQADTRIYTTIIYHMTVFISSRWSFLVQYIKRYYEEYREEAHKNVRINRMADMLVTLWLMVDFMKMFFGGYCGDTWSDEWVLHVKKELQNLVIANEEVSTDDDPAEIFMQALSTMINNDQIMVVRSDDREQILQKADGYETEEYYYLLPERIYEKVKDRLRRSGKEYALDLGETIKILYGSGCIHATSNGAKKKTYYSRIAIRDKRIKLIKISKAVIEKQLERDSV